MNLTPSQCKELIVAEASRLGVEKIAFASIDPVDDEARNIYQRWIEGRHHGEMAYMEKYSDVRDNPALLLPGAKTIVCCAINYQPRQRQDTNVPQIASYALGRDYHEVVRELLSTLATYIEQLIGAKTRVCVDTAPLRERYWAVKSGLGFVGINNQLIIPSRGSRFFLGEILITEKFPSDEPCTQKCLRCGACVKACPARAINADGSIDTQRCISYLTIEHRGDLPADVKLGNKVYGCDVCQDVCPHNHCSSPTTISDFHASEALLKLDEEAMKTLTPEQFSALFRHSAIKRTKYVGFMRNLSRVLAEKAGD